MHHASSRMCYWSYYFKLSCPWYFWYLENLTWSTCCNLLTSSCGDKLDVVTLSLECRKSRSVQFKGSVISCNLSNRFSAYLYSFSWDATFFATHKLCDTSVLKAAATLLKAALYCVCTWADAYWAILMLYRHTLGDTTTLYVLISKYNLFFSFWYLSFFWFADNPLTSGSTFMLGHRLSVTHTCHRMLSSLQVQHTHDNYLRAVCILSHRTSHGMSGGNCQKYIF